MINKARLLKRSIIAALLILIGFAGGTYFSLGLTASYMVFSTKVPEGAIACANLLQLEKGKSAALKYSLESDVDDALVQYSYASKEWWFPLFKDGWSLIPPEEFESWMHRIATYRKNHPSPYLDEFSHKSEKWKLNPNNRELVAANRNFQQRIDAMVKKFAKK